MFTALASICTGFVIQCIQGIKKFTTVGTGYVDDVTLFISLHRRDKQTELKVKKKIKQMATQWGKLLYLTGGKLELQKCFWLPITWVWKHGEPVIQRKTDRGGELRILDSESGDYITIPRIKPSDAEKRLGIRYAVNGDWRKELNHWMTFTTEYSRKLATKSIDRMGGVSSV